MGVRSASISRTTKSWPARRPTARTSVGSTPGSAARRSSAAASGARRSTTASTVKPRTFLPPPPSLTEGQRAVVAGIAATPPDIPVLIHGVTGSGKTLVYLDLLRSVVASGQGAILLVPEIA